MSYIGISDETLSIKVHVSGMKHVKDKGMKHVSDMKYVKECEMYMKHVTHLITMMSWSRPKIRETYLIHMVSNMDNVKDKVID